MARPRGRTFREADELATKPAPKTERPLDDQDDCLDELGDDASDGSEDPRHWDSYWSNWS